VSFVFVVVGLGALSAGLVAMLAITTQGVLSIPDLPTRKLLLRLAWLSLLLLCVTLLLLVWAILRHVRYRLHSGPPWKPSTYVNAWELAGKRFKLEDQNDEGQPDDEAPDA
jgi:hypothetical protein